MRRLVFVCLVALVATQAGGCIITSNGDDDGGDLGFITADWDFHTVSGTRLSCPPGFATVRVEARGPENVDDLYDCADFTSGAADYLIGDYDITIVVTNDAETTVYADSRTFAVDITNADGSVAEDFIDDGGRFVLDWDLRDAVTNAPLDCVGAGNPAAIEVRSTISGTSSLDSDLFDCEDGFGITDPLIDENYVVSISANNSAGQALGPSTNINTTITAPNGYTDLGVVVIEID